MPVDFFVNGRVYRDYLKDVSLGGASIAGRDPFVPGQNISISFPLAKSPNQINGEVVWVNNNAFGVAFKSVGPKCTELDLTPPEPLEDHPAGIRVAVEQTGRIRKKRIRWSRSSTAEVIRYRLYWSTGPEVDYDSPYIELGNVTEAVLPDDIPLLPLARGQVCLGITALNKVGNESDMTKVSAFLDFVVPEAPKQVRLEE